MKSRHRETASWALFSVALVLAGCGYYSTTSRTAKDIKSIHVPFFENQTPQPNLEITVTEEVINNLVADNTLKVTDEEYADAVLNGAIVEFRNNPFSFDDELNAQEYNILIRVQATLYNRRKNEPIWESKIFSGDGSYFVDVVDERAQTFDGAVAESIREITEQILNITVQDW
jgi:outer membrane lipopolysaccharide assembly protein LptE/RlpB